ncbi:nucleoside-diphosphate kinase [Enterococcus timonensis]|uniref:nucleoside-diphosphate kinase n=1 Tax=Enterococcus timonensis TaxID=1852364 RepID=UPI0008DA3C31|nr:nucleoside-diphosphate kinase [Enterococcus timonensis]
MEKTLVIIKPDGVKRRLVGKILGRFENKNLTIVAMRYGMMTEEIAKIHYAHLSSRHFFKELVDYMISGPVVYLVLEGEEVIDIVRRMTGATKSHEALPGTIRGDYGLPGTQNVIHASDSKDTAVIEIARFFPENE